VSGELAQRALPLVIGRWARNVDGVLKVRRRHLLGALEDLNALRLSKPGVIVAKRGEQNGNRDSYDEGAFSESERSTADSIGGLKASSFAAARKRTAQEAYEQRTGEKQNAGGDPEGD